jgi:catechol-2,3-dioxygenase
MQMTEYTRTELRLTKDGPELVRVKKYVAPSKEVLAELYRTARSVPDLDELAAWIAKMQGLHAAYQRAVRRETRRAKT